jgi:serine/threonine protein kinase
MADREVPPADAPTVDDTSDEDSLLRAIAAAPSVDVPVELATMVLLEPGSVVDGKFRIEERLGAGGMGVVYAAHDLALGREVAIKLMRLERSIGRLGERLPEVFDREARATARLNHPNIVTLHQFGNWNGIVYLVLERLRGETLSAKLERGRVPLLDALAVMEYVATALVHTHAAGVIHRDLKPQNVFLLTDGGVKVLDFGVSGLGLTAPVPETTEPSPRTTLAHAGTPGYMAPEQWRGEPQDARTDLWAVGVMLYQLVTNALPFGLRDAPQDVDLAPLTAKLPPEAKELATLVEKCLTIRRDDRIADAADVARTLHAIRTRLDPTLARAVQPRSLASRLARAGIGVALVLAINGTTVALWPDPPGTECDANAEKQLAGIWDSSTRARLGAMFAQAGPHGTSTWSALAMTLDRYAHEWVAMHAQACRAS